MPIHAENRARYPKDWKAIRSAVLVRAGNAGETDGCGAINGQPHPITGSKVVLTIAHLDHTPENCEPDNLRAWCQRCHNRYDQAARIAGRKSRLRATLAVGDLLA
jgi:5-methylcytosine-specific restriction endonuclease McrA